MPWLIWTMKDAKTAKVVGELSKSCDPAVSEWGNPGRVISSHLDLSRGKPGELKYLSTQRKRNRKRFP